MSRSKKYFYGQVEGDAARPAARWASREREMVVTAAGYEGAVRVILWRDGRGDSAADMAMVHLVPWTGRGEYRLLYTGPVSGAPAKPVGKT